METLSSSSLYPGINQYRPAPPGLSAGNIVVVVSPSNAEAEQKKFPRKNEALGAMQIVIAMIHIALGGILFFSSEEFVPLIMTVWYPFWGGGLFFISGNLASTAATKPVEGLATASHIFNILSGLGAIAGMCLLGIDLINIFYLHHHPVFNPLLNRIGFLSKYIVALSCEGIPNFANYCKTIKTYEMGIVFVMLIFSLLEAVTAFSTLQSNKKHKSHADNEEQNVALMSLPQSSREDGFNVPPPQYAVPEANRYSQLPGSNPGSTFTD
ncbi:B-lymphocyte antigen CD20-like isoform X1 [Rhineura floridana]|uniref:B-lymphocyte antigen CD20-like isoform X1 n=1 Tax=Rhineura floridana TaxID=261503 RepID=UPI002AC88AD7|nr:B-lymphocyte antigen CD20-like isoform X1 [Rhineura floridana]